MDLKKLIECAFSARQNSYSPYSHYMVGAAVLCRDGSIITGTNIENASYGATVCAERVAIFTAVASGHKDLVAIAVCGGSSDETDELSDYAYPCGICRQVMREFADPATFTVAVARSVSDYRKYTFEELFPDSFGPDNL
ncbi:MAG: cytidine deaminase [Lachnospiraceae bacterium]|nr:cytidine deaminase [Lachnospiraceae bacterium]